MSPKTRTALIALGALLLLIVLIALGRLAGGAPAPAGEAVGTTEARVRFLARCGWTVDAASEEVQDILLPETFSPVYEEYNELQKQQGYDLSEYKGLECRLYSYAVINGPEEEQTVLANLYVYKDRVIGGDVHSTSLNGFMVGLK